MGGRWRGREGGREGRTSCKETVLAEDGHGVNEEKDDIEDTTKTWHDWRSVGGLHYAREKDGGRCECRRSCE